MHDPLTGLPNRALFNERLEHSLVQANRQARIVAVMWVNLNDLNAINEQYGHEAGDSVLRIVSDRLRKITRRDDTLCRHGGAEFLFLLAEVREEHDVMMIANKLIMAIRGALEIKVGGTSVTVQVSASIGIAVFPKHGRDPGRLIRHAEVAMNDLKLGKSGQSAAFSS